MRDVVGALNATDLSPSPDASSTRWIDAPSSRATAAPWLTYGMEPCKYILTAFGRILMGGPLSVLCLTASSFFVACYRLHFTRIYRVTRSSVLRIADKSMNFRR